MKSTFLSLIITICMMSTTGQVQAQQDPMFTKYMFNPMAYNPAYAGMHDALSVALLHRQQWMGIKGAPLTQSVTAHTPLKSKPIGLGINLMNDNIGITNQLSIYAAYSYMVKVGTSGKLSFGLQGGVDNWRADFRKLNLPANTVDPSFTVNDNPNYWLPNFGAGIYYVADKIDEAPNYYIGLSCPRLLNNALQREGANVPDGTPAIQYRHYYLAGGMALPLSHSLIFRPSVLIKNVGLFGVFGESKKDVAAPTEIDIDLSLLMNDAIWVGAAFRGALEGKSSYDSVDFWASYKIKNGVRVGLAYDLTLSKLNRSANGFNGSYEVFLGYDFNLKISRVVPPHRFIY